MADLKQGLVHIIDEKEFDELLATRPAPLRIKAGFDPTAPDLHLGHVVLLKKLRQFQDAGHTVVMIVGGATAAIGDPTGRNRLRPELDAEQIQANSWTYMSQAKKILDQEKTVLRNNAEWFSEFKFKDVISLMSHFTLSEVGGRDEFKERAGECVPVFLHELFYPALQAYDSYREGVDIELGGSDQFYNMLMGRMYMHKRGVTPQVIATVPLLIGLDGKAKMSKSLSNHIGLAEPPLEMFSKVMSISDLLMDIWWNVLFPELVNEDLLAITPFYRKQRLAWSIVNLLHGVIHAEAAQREWQKIFTERQKPSEIQEVVVADFGTRLDKLLMQAGFTNSFGEGRRLIEQGAVEVGGVIATDNFVDVLTQVFPVDVRVGRRWARIKKA